MIKSDN